MADIDSRRFLAKPRFDRPVIVVYGSDEALIDGVARSLIGAFRRERREDVKLETIAAGDVANTPSSLNDFLNASTLFGDRRILWITGVGERLNKHLQEFLPTIAESNDLILFSSSSLRKKSKVLDLFRVHDLCYVLAAYETSLSRPDIQRMFSRHTDCRLDDAATDRLLEASKALDAASFEIFLQHTALYVDGASSVTIGDIDACLPHGLGVIDAEQLEAILSGDRTRILDVWRQFRLNDGDGSAFVALLGRQLTSALSTVGVKSPARGGLFWKLEKALDAAAKRLPRIRRRLEEATVLVHNYERGARSSDGGSSGDAEVERLLLRLASLFQR